MQLEEDFIEEFLHYLRVDCSLKQVSGRIYGFILKKVCRRAYESGLLSRPLFMHYKVERGDEALPRALDRDAFERIKSLTFHPLEQDLERVRNLFLLACYTGLAYSDLFTVKADHLCEDEYGALWLKFHRQKTKQLCRVKLLPEALRLLDLCRVDEESLFGHISYNHYSIALRALGERAGLSTPICSHMARHSFGTLSLSAGIPLERIAKMMGHKSLKSTQVYARVTDQKISEEIDRVVKQQEKAL